LKGAILTSRAPDSRSTIGTLQEKSLHAALKIWYSQPGDRLEVPIDGYLVDIVRERLLIEIQTRNFYAIKNKLAALIERHPVRLVYPIAKEKWILKLQDEEDKGSSRRRSPKRGRPEHLFLELVRFPQLVLHPNFSIEILLTKEEEIQVNDGKGAWRRKGWSIADRRLVEVLDRMILETPEDFQAFIPPSLPQPFTARELGRSCGIQGYIAGKMLYCLREMGAAEVVGRRKRAYLYSIELTR
jgi:hypothetical protein